MRRAAIVVGLLMLVVPRLVFAQDELFAGTWKANIAKSTYVPGPGPKLETLHFIPLGDRFRLLLEGANQKGPYHSDAIGKFDGVDVPVNASPAPVGVVWTDAFRRIDDRTWEIVIKMNGVPRILVHNVVSEDGKTMRSTSTVTSGGRVNQVVLYERE